MSIIVLTMILKGFITPRSEIMKRENNLKKKTEFSGIVQSKKITPENHNRTFIVLDNKNNIGINNTSYDKIKLKDSVVKRKNELIVTIYRDKQVFIVDY